ncbi:UbiA family prenyltransferase [Amycolatopsis cynarae]|uniref:UbiA family prenyltransferase n=1 Tax=Amycolatopsis cynarae TaxID=2995223 RepID=A0ABY7AUU1_9PSEU|nr:UbiA family prenyltransferase [Amycolatopsis sp. HUAS 11-8]WAL63479.1 UbiA family prenyltransferase [Amycolatopsis sp. HUAS 11-8]
MPGLAGRMTAADFAVLHRLQFPLPVNYVCYASWGCLFAAPAAGPAGLPAGPAVLVVVANLLLIVAPLAFNVAVDMPTDSHHREKGYLADAAGRVGRGRALAWANAEMAAGVALTVVIGLAWGHWWPLVFAAATVAAQLLYNVEPVRLKKRALAGAVTFGIASVGLPCLLAYTAVAAWPEPAVWMVFTGAAVLSVGRTVWWALPDLAADTASGIGTPTVRYGPARALLLACGLLLAGLVLLGWGLWWRYGLAWCLLGIAAHAVFLGMVWSRLPGVRRGELPDAKGMLKRTLPVVTLGEVLITVVALAA